MLRKPIALLAALTLALTGLSAQRIAYEWRGCMIDVSRHFFTVDFLKKQVDALSEAGINKLHLHLVDAGGWRLEIKQFPRLTEVGAWRTQAGWDEWWIGNDRQYASADTEGAYGGYYTQSEMRDLVTYAQARGVDVVPEIEMPGHSAEVMAAYPSLACNHTYEGQSDLCPGNLETRLFMQKVLDEVMDIFPSKYIHIGGDEADMNKWDDCTLCRRAKEQLGLKSNKELQDQFVAEMMQYVIDRGRTPIGWDEVLCDRLPRGSVIMVWRGIEKAVEAASLGYEVIMAPSNYCYLDYYQDDPTREPFAFGTYLPFEQTCALTDALIDSPHLIGVQGNLWTEFIDTPEHAEYMLYPRILAIGEIGRTAGQPGDYADLRRRIADQADRLRERGYHPFDLRAEKGHRPESLSDVQHLATGARVDYIKPWNPSYAAAAESTLTDGKRGDWNHNDNRWQGFKGDSCLDVVIDLGRPTKISRVKACFMQSDVAWIYLPASMEIAFSKNGKKFHTAWHKEQAKEPRRQLHFEEWGWEGRAKTRYIRLRASATSPDEWVFTDEVTVE